MKRELFISFTGHLFILIVIGIITSRQKPKPLTRPMVITVQILKGSISEPEKISPQTHLIEPPPLPTKSPKLITPKPNPPLKGDEAVVRRQGLGAKVDGMQVLGYNYYLQQMLERISENWEDPFLGRNLKLKTTVAFVIQRDGTLIDIKLEKSSGNGMFDESCVRAVTVTKRLPPLPAEFTAPRLKIHLEFER